MESTTYAGPLTAAAEKPTPVELEQENARLHKLVADLLVKSAAEAGAEIASACNQLLNDRNPPAHQLSPPIIIAILRLPARRPENSLETPTVRFPRP
jgi:hypothetical protein